MIVRALATPGRIARRVLAMPLAVGLAALNAVALPSAAAAAATADDPSGPRSAATATVHPGVQTETAGAVCTGNFIFSNGSEMFIGQAAHCSAKIGATETPNGCTAGVRPIGTPVTIAGAQRPGRLAYSSWNAMQDAGETDPSVCAYNDLGLVEIDAADVDRINPSLPVFGGPVGIDADGVGTGQRVFGYGNSPQRQNLDPLKPLTGISFGDVAGGLAHNAYLVPPVIPGDSGGPYVTADGRAFGSLIGVQFLPPPPGATLIADLAHTLAYANKHGDLGTLKLVPGTAPFRAQLLPGLGLGI